MLRPASAAALVRRAAPWLLAVASGATFADPADYVFVPYTSAGVRVAAWASGREHDRDGSRAGQQTLSLGWSPTARWFTSIYGAWEADDGAPYRIDEWSWLNHVQLTTPGAGPVDIGVLCEIEKPHDHDEGTGFKCGPTLELDTDELQWNLNPIFEKHVNAADPAPVSLGYQWQVKGMFGPHVELGAQGFGDVGSWNHWAPGSQQSHELGPAVFMKWMLADGHALKIDAAWLAGIGGGSPRDTLRLRVQHEF
jgi:hypothetical protein